MLKTLIIRVTVAALALCNPFVISAQGQTNSILDKVVAELVAAFNAKDATKLTSLYSEDAVLMPPNMPMIKGQAAIAAHFEKEFAGDMKLQLTPIESMIAGSQGFGMGTSTTVTFKRGGTSQTLPGAGSGAATTTEAGKYVLVFKMVGPDWKIAFDIFNSDHPAPAK
jgi:ketosteroid isomerase-like protein